ncbi:hypothetical protein Rrhod_1687 [Rhodococcus rhodnii LMG 5362]|uniref:RNA-directed DNA polymerase n=2 Tax=Rhodococcus rhodnii TaxID=38312 RepID=R7WNW2_9NOCA|nr:hypothetical protein Rrhod_1687 [Rhodococcus rhodnii LMG 5362]
MSGPWTKNALAQRFSEIGFDRAEEIARRLHDLAPTPPVDGVDAVDRLLAELPRLEGPIPVRAQRPQWLFGVPRWNTLPALASSLNLTPGELDWFADPRGWLRTKPDRLQHYRVKTLPSGRVVEIPKERLREVQRKVRVSVLDAVPPHPAAHGFRAGRGVVGFAAAHSNSEVVIRVDLRAFFTTITATRVRAVFAALGYPPWVAGRLAGLCTTSTPPAALAGVPFEIASLMRAPHLPQGAPTSPALSNLVAGNLDRRLSGVARRHALTYTRYADDLAFSGSDVDVSRLLAMVPPCVRTRAS